MTAEEYIKDFTRGCSNELENGEYEYWLTPWQAEAACNLKKEETINKACQWLGMHLPSLLSQKNPNTDCFIRDFIKYML